MIDELCMPLPVVLLLLMLLLLALRDNAAPLLPDFVTDDDDDVAVVFVGKDVPVPVGFTDELVLFPDVDALLPDPIL